MNAPKQTELVSPPLWEDTLHTLSKRLSHDFNNLASISYSLCELHETMGDFNDPDTLKEAFSFLRKNTQKTLNYHRQTLQLYTPHPDTFKEQIISLPSFIKEHLFFIELLLPKSVKIKTHFSENQVLAQCIPHNATEQLLATIHSISGELSNDSTVEIHVESTQIEINFNNIQPIVLTFPKAKA